MHAIEQQLVMYDIVDCHVAVGDAETCDTDRVESI